MKEIILSRGKVALVDDSDFASVSQFKWSLHRSRHRDSAFMRIGGGGGWVYMHRFILRAKAGVQVDHINHNALDNRRANLRTCTHSENQQNRAGADRTSKSGVRGVSPGRPGKWIASIKAGGKVLHLGVFIKKSDATSAYAVANKKYFGEFGGGI